LDEEKVEEGKEPRITKMYWTYWNGEEYIELEEDERSRHYVDLNFHVETKNYKDGDIMEIVLKRDDELPMCDEVLEIYLEGAVVDNKVTFKNPFHGYTLNFYP
jgi:hypothetical protein